MINLSVVIPNLNGEIWLKDSVLSLIRAAENFKGELEFILVDNGSVDGSVVWFKSWQKTDKEWKFRVIENRHNHGFARAVNQGIKLSKWEWVMIMNNDLVLSPDWLEKIVRVMAKRQSGEVVFGGTVLNSSGELIESKGLDFEIRGKCLNIGNGEKFDNKLLSFKSKKVWGLNAAATIYLKEALKDIGFFDADFFAYIEDVDVAFRLNQLGYQATWVPGVISYHQGGSTSNKMGNLRQRMAVRNWIWLIIKNYELREIWNNKWSILNERLRNWANLIKVTYRLYPDSYGWQIPKTILMTKIKIISKLPKMIKKRSAWQKIQIKILNARMGKI